MWVIEVLLFQNIDYVVSWHDTNQDSLLVDNWESVMVLIWVSEYFLDVLNGLNGSENIWVSFHQVVSFDSFAAFSDTVV